MAEFEVRGLELHSLYAWDYDWILRAMDFIAGHGMNTLVLHRNDFIDLIIYPGYYFGNEKRPYESIFERYSEIYRKLYKYTPTRRSGPYQRRAFFKRVLEQARRRNIQVFIENKELFFPDIILEFYPELVKEGHICASDPFWIEFTKEKYLEFFEEFPEVAGVITSPATGESRVSINSNRCQCERCRNTSRKAWFENILGAMYEPIHAAGKKLVVRDFAFTSSSQNEIAEVMENLPGDVVISLKNTPHDYFPTFPENGRIGHVGNHEQWIEFDTMGQYFGWGVGMADLAEDYRWRLESAKQKGVSGAIFRLDWESLDGAIPTKTHNLINVYAGALLTSRLDMPYEEIAGTMLRQEGWVGENASSEELAQAVGWYKAVSRLSWPVMAKTVFTNSCVFSDSSVIPISFTHAFWLAEEKNSLRDWAPEKSDALSPIQGAVEAALHEKEEAVQMAREMLALSWRECPAVVPEKHRLLEERCEVNLRYVELYRLLTAALMTVRYVTETQEDRTDAFYRACLEKADSSVKELEALETDLRQFAAGTDHYPHYVYTLLDPDRVRCLRKDLMKKLEEHRNELV